MRDFAAITWRRVEFAVTLLAAGCGTKIDFVEAGSPAMDGAAGDAIADISLDAVSIGTSFDAPSVEDASVDASPDVQVRLDVAARDDAPSQDAMTDVVDDGDGRMGDGSACPCVCTPTGCPAACASFATDTKNCGFAGHDCQGAICTAGQCEPTIVSSGGPLQSLAVDDARLYYAWGGPPGAPYGGTLTSAPTLFDGGGYGDYGNWSLGVDMVAVNPTDIFASFHNVAGTLIKRLSKSSAPGTVEWSIVVKMGGGRAGTLVLDSTHVYWTVIADGMPDMTFPNSVLRAPLEPVDGGAPEVIAMNQERPWGLAVDGGYAYWTSRDGGAIRKASVTGGAYETLAANQGDPYHLAVFAGYVYWTDLKQDTVSRISVDGGTAEIVARDQDGPSHIAVDASGIYWTSERGFRVMKATVAGCEPGVLASRLMMPTAIALSQNGVHWINSLQNSESVMTLPK